MRRFYLAFLLTVLLIARASCVRAQTIVVHGAAGPVHLDGPWVLNQDDPPTAPLLSNALTGQTLWLSHASSSGTGSRVVRIRVNLIAGEPISDPALLINPNANDCQVFVNGREAANCARWPRTTIYARRWLLVRLPSGPVSGPVQIALRIVGPEGSAAILPRSSEVLFGRAPVLEDIRTAADALHFYARLPQALLCLGELTGALILLLVFFYDRRRPEYLWFAAFLLLDGTMSLTSVFNGVFPLFPSSTSTLTDGIGMIGRYVPLVGFIAAFTGVRLNRWMRGYQLLLVAAALLIGMPYLSEDRAWMPALSNLVFGGILFFVQIPFIVFSLGFLGWQWKRGNREAALLLPSFLLASACEILGLLVPGFRYFRFGPFGVSFDDLSMFFFLVSIGPVLLFRHRRITLEHSRATAELLAAREIQQRLVPNSIPALPGCHIEAAYLPAQEVGGDFYQILQHPNGSTVIVVGDVSGKGLKAAMTGSLVIGALRILAVEGLGPAGILMRLNSELARSSDGGFVTCFCATLAPDGALRIANAGHLAPFC
ncbi:MAG: SpoIIE family protein phosphatase, partial [Terracidiphilus sp.]